MLLQVIFLSVFAFASSVFAAFGYTTSGSNYVIDAGSDNAFVFQVSSSSCDINSIKFRGVEYQYASTGTHLSSGLGSATVSVTTVSGKQYHKDPSWDLNVNSAKVPPAILRSLARRPL